MHNIIFFLAWHSTHTTKYLLLSTVQVQRSSWKYSTRAQSAGFGLILNLGKLRQLIHKEKKSFFYLPSFTFI